MTEVEPVQMCVMFDEKHMNYSKINLTLMKILALLFLVDK